MIFTDESLEERNGKPYAEGMNICAQFSTLIFFICALFLQHGAASSFPPAPSGFHSPYWQGPSQNRRDTRPPGYRDRPRSPIQVPVKQQEVPAVPLGKGVFFSPET